MRLRVVGYLIAIPRSKGEHAPVLKFRYQLPFKDEKDMAARTPMIADGKL